LSKLTICAIIVVCGLFFSGFFAPKLASAAPGDIGDAVIESLEFDTSDGFESSIVAVDSDTFAIVYAGPGGDVILKTVDIDSLGDISAVVDTLIIADLASFSLGPDIVAVDSDTFAIVYTGADSDGFLTTVDITAAGDIAAAVTETLEYATDESSSQKIISVDSDTFAIAYRGVNVGQLATVDITSTGDIAAAVTEKLTFEAGSTDAVDIVAVDSDTFAIAYGGPDSAADGNDGFLKTVDITSTGDIAAAVTDTLEFDTDVASDTTIIKLDSDTFAIAYGGPDNDGFLKTVDITSTGDIAAAVTDTLEYETDDQNEVSIVQVDSDTVAIAHSGTDLDGFVRTVDITAAGDIAAAVTDTLEFDTSNGRDAEIIKVDADTFAIAYTGVDEDGFLVTISIEAESSSSSGSVKSNNRGGIAGCLDCIPPTLGIDHNGKRVVDYGFSYNGNPVQVERFHTDYPLITVQIGKLNTAELKIYENKGERKLTHVGLAFGLDSDQVFADSKAIIEWDRDLSGQETITKIDPNDVIDDDSLRIESSKVQCKEGGTEDRCTLLKIFHKMRDKLDFNIVKTYVWDYHRNGWQNTYNHGIHIEGKSMNPPVQHSVSDGRDRILITEIAKDTAVDVYGNVWTFDKSWKKEYVPYKVVDDGITMHLYPRGHSSFDTYKMGQELLANQILEQICSECIDEPFDKIENTFAYDGAHFVQRENNPGLQSDIAQEILKAEESYQNLYSIHDRITE